MDSDFILWLAQKSLILCLIVVVWTTLPLLTYMMFVVVEDIKQDWYRRTVRGLILGLGGLWSLGIWIIVWPGNSKFANDMYAALLR